jgi:hypothetical protein
LDQRSSCSSASEPPLSRGPGGGAHDSEHSAAERFNVHVKRPAPSASTLRTRTWRSNGPRSAATSSTVTTLLESRHPQRPRRALLTGSAWQRPQPPGSQIATLRAAGAHVAVSLDSGRRVEVRHLETRQQRGSVTGRLARRATITRACELIAALPSGTVLVTGRNRTRGIAFTRSGSSRPRLLVRLGRRPLTGADADANRLAWAVQGGNTPRTKPLP